MQLGDRRVLHPGRLRRMRALAWLVLLFFLTAGAFGLPLQWAVDHLPPDNEPLQLAGLVSACMVALGCYAVAVRLGEGRGARELALRPAPVGLACGALLGLVMMTALMGVLVATGAYDVTAVGSAPAWTGVGLALQAAVTEELWMRALLFRLLWRAFGPVPALAVAAAVFAALHLTNPGATALAGATVAMAGAMFCALYALTGRLWLPIGVHAAWNLAQGYLFGAAVSGGDLGGSIAVSTARAGAPTWLTGGAFGPEASVVALALVTAVTVGALALVGQPEGILAGTSSQGRSTNPEQEADQRDHENSWKDVAELVTTSLVGRSAGGRHVEREIAADLPAHACSTEPTSDALWSPVGSSDSARSSGPSDEHRRAAAVAHGTASSRRPLPPGR